MVEICPTCGLPKEICACIELSREQQKINIRLETRKFGKPATVISGIEDERIEAVAQTLKKRCACGGTAKNGLILLQGDHREKLSKILVELGYPKENIENQ
jgi:translation initiation factor 1